MVTLKAGSFGEEVMSLQHFLNNYAPLEATGSFGNETTAAVLVAQEAALNAGLKIGNPKPDGIVGPMTAGAFQQMGWQRFQPSTVDPNMEKPKSYLPLSSAEKVTKFGVPGKPKAKREPGGPIDVDPAFSRSLVTVDMRNHMKLPPGFQSILTLNPKVKDQWIALFRDIESEGHSGDLISCGGSWAPRYVRGSVSTFSSHAFATAVDFNAPQNWLGATPAKRGETGYLGNIIALAKKRFIYSGAWFSRLDGMHLESTRTDEELRVIGCL